MANDIFTKLGISIASPSNSDGTPRKPVPQDFQVWMTEVERLIKALIAGAGGTIDLPDLIYKFTITGGSENNIVAVPNATPPSAPGEALLTIQTTRPNTGAVTINGKPLRTNSGNEITPGGMIPGIWMFLDNGNEYRLVSDLSSAAILAAAEQAAASAQEAKDLAAGYVNDVAMEKEVPIFSTVASMPNIEVLNGITSIQILGRNQINDVPITQWTRVAGEPDVAPGLKFRSKDRFLPNLTTDPVNGGWWLMKTDQPRINLFKPGYNIQSSLDFLRAKMAGGGTVKIVCYGDSTTDGNGTTDHVRNPVDVSGNAIGQSDQNLAAPNAWPKITQTLLRLMNTNNNIHVYNAGYSGRQVINGWAYDNYERAIINNPFYGVPDAVFIAFGLNDAATAGSSYEQTKEETLKLCLKVMSYGSIPVLVSCDANGRTSDARDNREVTRQIDAAKKALASELGIPFIEMAKEQEKWFETNKDGFRFVEVQPDLLHFGDKGHIFKAMVACKYLFDDLAFVENGRSSYSYFSKAGAGRHGESSNIAALSASPGGNFVANLQDVPIGTRVIDTWVWNDKPDGALIYRGISTEATAVETGLITTGHSIEVSSLLTGTTKKVIPSVGIAQGTGGYRGNDIPYIFGHLPYGLSRVSYIRGQTSGNNLYYGYFDFKEMPRGNKNALSKTGPIVRYYGAIAENRVEFAEEATDASNVWGKMGTEAQDILIDMSWPKGVGLLLACTKAWNTNPGTNIGDKRALMAYRRGSSGTDIGLYHVRYTLNNDEENRISYLPIGGTVSWFDVGSAERLQMRFRFNRSGDNQRIQLWNKWTYGPSEFNLLIPNTEVSAYMAGALGGFFVNAAEKDESASPILHAAIII